jgi:hypothetical protein
LPRLQAGVFFWNFGYRFTMTTDHGRRAFLRAAGAIGLLNFLPGCGSSAPLAIALPARGEPGRFLDAHELDTLRAVTGRFVPGPPDDVDPGAIEARCAEAIDLMLGAFNLPVPPIHAGGPYSDRAGAAHNDFADYLPLDALAELGWRIRIEGSQGLAEREFAGPVIGLQQIYRDGLKHLDERAQSRFGGDFISRPGIEQDLLLADLTDGDAQALVGAALANTMEFLYGPPEYGGNQALVGWTYTGWPGDTQPRGFTDAEVSTAGPATLQLAAVDATALMQKFIGGFAGLAATRAQSWRRRRAL